MSPRRRHSGPGRPKLPEADVKNVNLAIKATSSEAKLLRRVGTLFVGGFSGWARLLLLRAAREEGRRAGLPLPSEEAPPPRRRS